LGGLLGGDGRPPQYRLLVAGSVGVMGMARHAPSVTSRCFKRQQPRPAFVPGRAPCRQRGRPAWRGKLDPRREARVSARR
jgi:hypothetical protein